MLRVKRRGSSRISISPRVVFFAPIALAFAVEDSLASRAEPRFMNRALGLAVGLVGLRLVSDAAAAMSRKRQSLNHRRLPTGLVTDGPYRFTRNPVYLSFILFSLAFSVLMRSRFVMAATPISILLLQQIVIHREEELLEKAFGAEYTAYKQRVRRWI